MDNNMHVHDFRETVVPPTCRESGYTLYSCACGYEHKGKFKPAAAHSFHTVETTPATCTEPGSKTGVCKVCGQTQTKSIPALGHDYGEWVVQEYPTCTQEGSQFRQCSRCSAVETGTLKATGHRRASGTEHYVKGKLVDYFCENCGQTVSYAETLAQEGGNKKHYWPTRILLLATVAATLLNILFMVLWDLTGFIYPWLSYSAPLFTIIWLMVFFFAAGKIKRGERYPRWLGAPMLMFLMCRVATVLFPVLYLCNLFYGFRLSRLLPLLIRYITPEAPCLLFELFLAVVLFIGVKKKLWVFIVASVLAAVCVGFTGLNAIVSSFVQITYKGYFDGILYCSPIITSFCSSTLLYASILMLITPVKKRATMV